MRESGTVGERVIGKKGERVTRSERGRERWTNGHKDSGTESDRDGVVEIN
jgi:hypothetical protein